ncbi:MAG: cysteine--tRNA ligase [Clostridia bacterium]|nr:cysteine--tRNA ligase [Clostridia bacterium]MDD4049147.1 cysteine--tRNA ligase [Clostridia bacterium]
MSKEGLKIYNTITGEKEKFIPINKSTVGMYTCGPTTYNFIHLGNARPLVIFDTVRRYLEYVGYEVVYIQNFTDVDDKIINKAQKEEILPLDLAEKYIEEYFKDADALNVKRASVHPRVSRNMEEIINFVEGLVKKGYAYVVEGDVYFEVSKFKKYGKLSKRTLENLWAGARVKVDERKRHPGDFALWKKVKPGELWWDSPWGQGRPGWHIECSAMSKKYLGTSFDIHGGGFDLIFPHHENEIAQSEAFNGVLMAKYWMHNGFITVNQEKMSKSLGNFFLIREIFQKYSPQVVRFYLLSTHYRSLLDFDDNKLEVARKGLERLETAYRLLEEAKDREVGDDTLSLEFIEKSTRELQNIEQRFEEAMDDDFNTALAIAVLFDFARSINGIISSLQGKTVGIKEKLFFEKVGNEYLKLTSVLGIKMSSRKSEEECSGLIDPLIQILIKVRCEAKERKDYNTADNIRDELKSVGIALEDTPQGVRWKYL